MCVVCVCCVCVCKERIRWGGDYSHKAPALLKVEPCSHLGEREEGPLEKSEESKGPFPREGRERTELGGGGAAVATFLRDKGEESWEAVGAGRGGFPPYLGGAGGRGDVDFDHHPADQARALPRQTGQANGGAGEAGAEPGGVQRAERSTSPRLPLLLDPSFAPCPSLSLSAQPGRFGRSTSATRRAKGGAEEAPRKRAGLRSGASPPTRRTMDGLGGLASPPPALQPPAPSGPGAKPAAPPF